MSTESEIIFAENSGKEPARRIRAKQKESGEYRLSADRAEEFSAATDFLPRA